MINIDKICKRLTKRYDLSDEGRKKLYELIADIFYDSIFETGNELSIPKFCANFRKDFLDISAKDLAQKNNVSVNAIYRFEELINTNYQYIIFYLNVMDRWQRHLFIDLLFEVVEG